jgi:ketosteroid isomerase-like protein
MAHPVEAQNGMNQKSTEAIKAVIEAQRVAWNNGDIEGYMNGYEKSESTVFVSGEKVTHGWQTVFEHYKKSYDTREKMGELTFSDLEFKSLSKDHVAVVGRWALKRNKDAPHGLFTLIFKKTKLGWRIIHDHTS